MDTEEFVIELEEDEEERQRQLRRKQRIEEMRREKKKTEQLHKYMMGAAVVALLFVGIGIGVAVRSGLGKAADSKGNQGMQAAQASGSDGVNAVQTQEDSEVQVAQAQSQSGTEVQGWQSQGDAGADESAQAPGTQGGADGSAQVPGIQEGAGDLETGDGVEDAGPAVAAGVFAMTGLETEESPFVGTGIQGGGDAQLAFEFVPYSTAATVDFGESVSSEYGVLIDAETGEILAARGAEVRMNPASMTKILTVLTAADALGIGANDAPVLNDTFVMTREITDYSYVNDCSIAGFGVGEEITVRDLFYGTILPSGADAAVGLAVYVSGSHETFMELMNRKLAELGISESTHFENCVGLYGEEHYTTVSDMAVILKAAADNDFCREVLSAHTYNTSFTEQHPEGILLSNWFLRRIEDRDTHGEVLCGKTGFVNQSGSCAASLATDLTGREYLCVTAGAASSWKCIYDQVDIFQAFL